MVAWKGWIKIFFACGGRSLSCQLWELAQSVPGWQTGRILLAVMKGLVSAADDHDYNLKCFHFSTNLPCDEHFFAYGGLNQHLLIATL